jgi:DNA-binding response OmpR family regulator
MDATERPQMILVADDDEDILALVAFRLRRDGHEVVTAGNGEEALLRARERTPDLFVLDVRMPGMTGLDVIRELRGSYEMKDVPVIFLTASVQEESIERGYQAGADDYVKKPFSPEELTRRVQALLARPRAQSVG